MAKNLVIVESPAKAKTIARYLGKDYEIKASVGHIRDLPSSSLGVDVNNGFKPRYITMKGKNKIVKELKSLAEDAEKVFIATDPDREGEAIAWHIAKVLGIETGDESRISFNEITEKTVKNAVSAPRKIDKNLVNSQQARRILDRLVGYELSPLLWKKIRSGLSAGRVQSVATRMLVEREEEINAFTPEEYWIVDAKLKNSEGIAFTAKYFGKLSGGKAKSVKLSNKEDVEKLLNSLKDEKFSVKSVKKGNKQRRPYAPFTTSTLQQDASRKLGFSAKKTMAVAQQLYEGINIEGQGQTALVSYIRTDSVRISPEAAAAAATLIKNSYGDSYLPKKPPFYKNKNAAQDAHEAIRPTHFELAPEKLQLSLSRDQFRLYRLIWYRFIASQMAPALLDTLKVDILYGDELFRAGGEKIRFKGFLLAYDDQEELLKSSTIPESDKNGTQAIPELRSGEVLSLEKLVPQQKFTKAPPRYTEASLIKAMEEEGIGRPSTYAPTISTVLARGYAEKESKQLIPTELGTVVTDMLRDNFPDIVDIKFTANMENELDEVEEGKMDWQKLLGDFYRPFHESIEKAQEKVEKLEMKEEKTGEVCPECGGELIFKRGRFGRFIACSNFPDCKYTAPLSEKAGSHCPKCGAELLKRKSRRGSIFYICSKSNGKDDCDFISWDLPIDGSHCEKCGAYMVQKRYRGRSFQKCSNPDCVSNQKKESKKKEDKTESDAEKEQE